MNDMNSLSHTKWECKYHMLVAIPPKMSVSRFMGDIERKKYTDDFRQICKSEV